MAYTYKYLKIYNLWENFAQSKSTVFIWVLQKFEMHFFKDVNRGPFQLNAVEPRGTVHFIMMVAVGTSGFLTLPAAGEATRQEATRSAA